MTSRVRAPASALLSRRTAAACLLGASAVAAARPARALAPKVVRYNQGNGLTGEADFSYKVLELALSRSGKRYALEPSALGRTTERRTVQAIMAGDGMDVAMLGAKSSVDALLAPVPIPVDRGLLGFRVFVIRADRRADFSKVRTLADLRRQEALQGYSWADTDVMRASGLTVWTGEYRQLYPMMAAGRADFLPRGAAEIYKEFDRVDGAGKGLAIEGEILLRYRFTPLFYVAKGNQELRGDIWRGFLEAYADGSYRRLFNSDPDVGAALDRIGLRRRRVIELPNPFLSPALARVDEKFWLQPG